MSKKVNALKINQKDNVATALGPMAPGDMASIIYEKAPLVEIVSKSEIPLGHKIAATTIPKGELVIKYGESIGQAMVDVEIGSHVHIHNVQNLRARTNE